MYTLAKNLNASQGLDRIPARLLMEVTLTKGGGWVGEPDKPTVIVSVMRLFKTMSLPRKYLNNHPTLAFYDLLQSTLATEIKPACSANK